MSTIPEWQLKSGRRPAVSGPVVTVVMDGVGLGPLDDGNAYHLAKTPVLDGILSQYGHLALTAHGKAVGLPTNKDLGNSEVGHNAIGGGRIFQQGAALVETAIETGALFEGETWQWLVEKPRSGHGVLHFIGLLSDGNVHSHERHLHAMLRMAAKAGVPEARVHVLLDGRDVGQMTALTYLERLEAVLSEVNEHPQRNYRIASGGGRMIITMDRYEAEWSMVETGWRHHVQGEGRRFASAEEAVRILRDETNSTDQYLPPFVIADDNGPLGPITDGDSVCFFNFRGDRSIEISQAFEAETFDAFDRGRRPDVRYAGMMQYDGDRYIPNRFLVSPPAIERTMSEYLVRNGIHQFACSETQKYGHVTYFWNGNRSGYFDESLELYREVPSDVLPFEHAPHMKAAEIVDATLDALKLRPDQVGRINLANGDMVGHTGVLDAAILAMETVDQQLGLLLDGIRTLGGVALVTADHGNCEEMYERKKDGSFAVDEKGQPRPRTSHTTNAVPLCLFDPHGLVHGGLDTGFNAPGLSNLAATILELKGFSAPEDYAPSLLR